MTDRNEIVRLARECLDTPFAHEGRIAGDSIDCVGVLIHVWHGLGLPPYVSPPYGRSPHPRRMSAELEQNLARIAIGAAGVGDVLHMAWEKYPQHLAIVTDRGILHALGDEVGRCVEHGFDGYWRARVRAAYRFPGVV